MADFISNQQQIEVAAILLAMGGFLSKWIPSAIKWIFGNAAKDNADKFIVLKQWIEQLSKDIQEARKESRAALHSVEECESKHNDTLKFMYEDRVKYEKQMAHLEAQLDFLKQLQIGKGD